MSRHRAVRNLDLDEELAEDDYYDEDPYDNLSPEDNDAMAEAYAQTLDVLGPIGSNGFTEREVKDILWDAYFDVDSAVTQLVEEKSRREAKAEKDRQKQESGDMQLDDDEGPTIEAFKELSLQRDRRAEIRGGRGMSRGRAQGLRGLATGGRAGMAKRNLAGLAPDFVRGPQGASASSSSAAPFKPTSKLSALAARSSAKRPAENPPPNAQNRSRPASPAPPSTPASASTPAASAADSASAASPARTSKLAALAAARSGAVASSSKPAAVPPQEPSTSAAATSDAATKPLSKLQQRMLANKQQRQAATPEAKEAAAAEAAEEEARSRPQTCYGSDLPISSLFPTADPAPGPTAVPTAATRSGTALVSTSAIAGPSKDEADQLVAPLSRLRQVPGGSPFALYVQGSSLESEPGLETVKKAFAGPSPDDVVMEARQGTRLAAKKAAASANASAPASGTSTPLHRKAAVGQAAKAAATKPGGTTVSQLRNEIEALDMHGGGSRAASSAGSAAPSAVSTPMGIAHERIIDEYRKREKDGKAELSLVVVGHVDAGKSTLMGRMLLELGSLSQREYSSNERASQKIGKGSFAYAWALDSSEEERERGVTIDVAQDHFSTQHRTFTLLDAPGHRDFIPNMISGAAQADSALLVVDSIQGAFEAGFGPNGQTREHALLVRSLGVQQLVIVVNKLDAVGYSQERYDEIVSKVKPFLTSCGFDAGKLKFVPCGGSVGENLAVREEGGALSAWYTGPTLVEILDALEPPARQLDSPLRLPVTNVFKGQTAIASGVGVSGRVVSGIVQIGDRLRPVPGDESGIVRAIEVDSEPVPWAVAGANATVYLSGIDQIQVSVGAVLCAPSAPIALCDSFLAQILVFEPTYPLVAGTSVELFHHSANIAATLTELVSILDKTSGGVAKKKPRVLTKGCTAMVRVTVKAGGMAGQSSGIPLEDARTNKEMARVLMRMNGETVAAGIVVEAHTAA
ncbi:Translation elongation factor EFTu/EF1A, domain 2 [Kalmanozyma brasiliensis GHG001]|uniref:Elongation factor 1 alpha-like protein n=1 Tax=Kalmanozyma brasiliensis (strain GHG001) TaxID=1365824 RepID=V5EUF2_KALBG|nr:Translation elongation factor EFTu/EF1A, domain 2 [Kalmanozyma brasiliensis GHG001]EST09005.1 Translation elongation factor EFTu/EF1A, domain 2 [Kalmanozyma brasiliensis GHG001]